MKYDIDPTIFKDLEALSPEDVISRTNCTHNKEKNHYLVNIWGTDYRVDVPNRIITVEASGTDTGDDYLNLFILYYLIKSKNILTSGVWISEKDIPGGAAFFRGPHEIPGHLITRTFGNDMEAFEKRCQELNGQPIDMADAAFSFDITPTIPAAILYFKGDEDFESEAKLLFDRTISIQLPLDIVYALAVEICHKIGSNS